MKIIKKCLNNKYLYYIIFSMLIIGVTILTLKYNLAEYSIKDKKYLALASLIELFIMSISLGLIYFKDKKKISIDKVFLITAVVMGITYLVLSPLFTGSDEHNHYYRIYEITEGVLVTPVQENNKVGSELPSSLLKVFINDSNIAERNIKIKYKDEFDMVKVKEEKNKRELFSNQYCNTALYSPLQYLPQVIGFLIGKCFKLNPFLLGELGRIFNLLFYVGICTFFMRKLPKLKLFAMLILLSPNLLSSATTLSSDAFTCALIFGFLSLILHYMYSSESITKIDLILLLVISIFISTCKIVYFPLILLLFIIPNNKFGSTRRKMIFISLSIILAIIVGGYWLNITNRYFDAYYVNTSIQKTNILHNFINYFFVIFRTYLTECNTLLLNLFGGNNMYHSQLQVYSFISIAYLIIVFLSLFNNDNSKNDKLDLKEKMFIILIMLLIIVLITTAIYVQCTANFYQIDNPIVGGLQGRYFIPIVLCLILFNYKNIKMFHYDLYSDICILLNTYVLFQMLVHFVI